MQWACAKPATPRIPWTRNGSTLSSSGPGVNTFVTKCYLPRITWTPCGVRGGRGLLCDSSSSHHLSNLDQIWQCSCSALTCVHGSCRSGSHRPIPVGCAMVRWSPSPIFTKSARLCEQHRWCGCSSIRMPCDRVWASQPGTYSGVWCAAQSTLRRESRSSWP